MSEPGTGQPLRHRLEDLALVACLAAMVALPVAGVVLRRVDIPSGIVLVQQLTLWLGLLGAGVAAREGRHLALAPIAERFTGRWLTLARVIGAAAGGAVAALLARASGEFVAILRQEPTLILGVPQWVWALILPVGFLVVAVRQVVAAPGLGRAGHVAVALLVAVVLLTGLLPAALRPPLVWPGLGLLVLATALGAPLFSLLGGAALLLYWAAGDPTAAIPIEAFRLTTSPSLPTIPLFTLAGYVLAEGGTSKRLVRVFRALFGFLPGGLAVAAACACAFFTTFTGGSGITILALGGLLLPALREAGYRERYATGLITASGSLGLLFPPSLPVILYGIVAETPIDRLFAGALLPGVVLLLVVALTGFWEGWRTGAGRAPFVLAEARAAVWEAKWELALPVVVLWGMFGGFATFVEAAAITALYAIVVETAIYRDLDWRRALPRTFVTTGVLVGGVITILAVALGLTSYLIDAEVPAAAATWVQASISSRLGFLLALNLFLLAVGCLMDVFSAIVVVVPILKPMAAIYGVDPVHLGVIFLANLELGFLTPPVGLNLFLASYRFDKPLLEVCRAALPFLLLLLLAVIVITYVPALTAFGVGLLGQPGP